MRKLILIILVLIGFSAIAQTPPRTGYLVNPSKWKMPNPLWLDSGAYITKIVKTSGQNRYLVYDSLSGKIGYRFVSSATTIDTTSLSNRINLRVKYTDTSSMLSKYLRASDTLKLSNRINLKQNILSLTTTGTSGAATLTGATLNIPQYSGTTYTAGNGLILGGSTFYRDSLKTTGQYGNSWQNGMMLKSTNNRSMLFGTNNLLGMTLDSNQRLGIGARLPTVWLDVTKSTTGNTNDFALFKSVNGSGFGTTNLAIGHYYDGMRIRFASSLTSGTSGNINWDGSNNIFEIATSTTANLRYTSLSHTFQINGTTNLKLESGKLHMQVITASANYGTLSLSNTSTAFDGSTTGYFVGSPNGQYIAVNSVGSVAHNFLQFSKNGLSVFRVDSTGKETFASTITAGGTTGNQTINKPSGTVNIAAAGTSVTVTNSLVSTSSIVVAVLRTNDSTAYIKNVVPSAGSFVITLGVAATAEVSIGFIVYN